MSGIGPTDAEIRVLGSLIEKQRATPDHYPLTLNALRLACNQSTNRDPVVTYDEATVREALGRLGRRRWIRSASGHTSRVPKYRHLLEEELKLSPEQLSLLAVMMLRGPQTPGELKGRSDRLCRFESLDDVHLELEGLIELGHVERLDRMPGQKEERYRQLLGGDRDGEGPDAGGPVRNSPSPSAPALSIRPEPDPPHPDSDASGRPEPDPPHPDSDSSGRPEQGGAEPGGVSGVDRVERLEGEVAELRREIEGLRREIEELR